MNRDRLIELAELLEKALAEAERCGDPFGYVYIKEQLGRANALLEEEEDCEKILRFMEELK